MTKYVINKASGSVFNADVQPIKPEFSHLLSPVLVLDPDDADAMTAIRALMEILERDHDWEVRAVDGADEAFAAAVRTFIEAKPAMYRAAEPTGIHAVVRDDDGEIFYRHASGVYAGPGGLRHWADFSDDVEVLWPGLDEGE